MAAAIEAHNDENGMVWPINIAPFEVAIVVANVKDEQQIGAARDLYSGLKGQGIDVLLDDREERVGVKFKDMDLIGVPIQVVVGKGLADGTSRGWPAAQQGYAGKRKRYECAGYDSQSGCGGESASASHGVEVHQDRG